MNYGRPRCLVQLNASRRIALHDDQELRLKLSLTFLFLFFNRSPAWCPQLHSQDLIKRREEQVSAVR